MIHYLKYFDVIEEKLEFSVVDHVLKMTSQKAGLSAASILSPFQINRSALSVLCHCHCTFAIERHICGRCFHMMLLFCSLQKLISECVSFSTLYLVKVQRELTNSLFSALLKTTVRT